MLEILRKTQTIHTTQRTTSNLRCLAVATIASTTLEPGTKPNLGRLVEPTPELRMRLMQASVRYGSDVYSFRNRHCQIGTGCLSGVILALELKSDAEKCTRIRGASAQTGVTESLTSLGLPVFVLTRVFRYSMFAQKRAAAVLSARMVERWTETFRRVQICAHVFASVSPSLAMYRNPVFLFAVLPCSSS